MHPVTVLASAGTLAYCGYMVHCLSQPPPIPDELELTDEGQESWRATQT